MYNALNRLRTLFDEGKIREVPVFGRLNSFFIQGSIDEVCLNEGKTFVLENKTRRSSSMPSQAQLRCNKFQVQVYWKILSDLRDGKIGYKDLEEFYGFDSDNLTQDFLEELDSKTEGEFEPVSLEKLGELVFEGFSKIPPLSKSLKLRYFSQETGKIIGEKEFKFDREEFGEKLDFVSEYWSGEREAVPVGEKNEWKCNYCDFTSACDQYEGDVDD
ncbi:hypothetical protein AKJ52_01360 [candidate division MSBL1 archaeon SCGC-AAA382C18]|uniref:PD-(D/E)XK endonuclease-like domain-containing protein n=1 Tax=candidate division MSBL1 archaeon SCGC-AAA382C18 TaxID=1698281 RepID=A0A133VKC8_9EURY|nr:hypothetical protein AKJ52_01360 [candidate division MSBL1 archaeon SCGC-AAA382C18]